MPRAIWSGSISFGLVNIPIKLYTAVSKKSVSFNQIDARSGTRVKMQRVSSADGSEVPYDQIVKGYELTKDHYVLIEPEELESLDPETTRSIDIEEFVDLAEIDPIYYDAPYYVAPVKAAEKPYALLVRAMEQQEKVAIARFVMRTKQYLAALRPVDDKLVLSTMVYADEISEPEEIPELDDLKKVKVSDKELSMAKQLIDSLTAEFEPDKFHDEYRERVLELIEKKSAGEEIVIEAPSEPETKVVDLMAALEASVREAREARKRHPATSDDEADDDDAESGGGTATKTRAKSAAKKTKKAPAKKKSA